jgi:hypothetical protein
MGKNKRKIFFSLFCRGGAVNTFVSAFLAYRSYLHRLALFVNCPFLFSEDDELSPRAVLNMDDGGAKVTPRID